MAREVMHDLSKLDRYIKDARELEHAADAVTTEILARMKRVFITPIDREDFICSRAIWTTVWMTCRTWS